MRRVPPEASRTRSPAPLAARFAAGVLLGVLLAAPLPAAAPAGADLIDKILATVDGEPITLYQLKQYAAQSIRGRETAAADQPALLDALITEQLIDKEVSAQGIIVRDADIDHYIDGVKARNKLSDDGLKQALAAQGLTMKSYRTQIRKEIEKAQLMNREVRGKVTVTPEDVQRYYQEHLADYATPARIKVAHILLRLAPDAPPDQVAAVTAKAQAIYQRLQQGADFATLARQYSEDPSGQKGGDLGWFKKGELLDPLETAAAQLKVGAVSPPVRTPLGLHILKLEAREGAAHESLDALAPKIKEQLYNAALEARFQKWVTEDLRKQHQVEVLQ